MSNLTHMDARWYSADIQRFLQPDYYNIAQLQTPMAARHLLLAKSGLTRQDLMMDPSQQIRYGYVGGNQLGKLDWNGLFQGVDVTQDLQDLGVEMESPYNSFADFNEATKFTVRVGGALEAGSGVGLGLTVIPQGGACPATFGASCLSAGQTATLAGALFVNGMNKVFTGQGAAANVAEALGASDETIATITAVDDTVGLVVSGGIAAPAAAVSIANTSMKLSVNSTRNMQRLVVRAPNGRAANSLSTMDAVSTSIDLFNSPYNLLAPPEGAFVNDAENQTCRVVN